MNINKLINPSVDLLRYKYSANVAFLGGLSGGMEGGGVELGCHI